MRKSFAKYFLNSLVGSAVRTGLRVEPLDAELVRTTDPTGLCNRGRGRRGLLGLIGLLASVWWWLIGGAMLGRASLAGE